jgi:hypothetical protein
MWDDNIFLPPHHQHSDHHQTCLDLFLEFLMHFSIFPPQPIHSRVYDHLYLWLWIQISDLSSAFHAIPPLSAVMFINTILLLKFLMPSHSLQMRKAPGSQVLQNWPLFLHVPTWSELAHLLLLSQRCHVASHLQAFAPVFPNRILHSTLKSWLSLPITPGKVFPAFTPQCLIQHSL